MNIENMGANSPIIALNDDAVSIPLPPAVLEAIHLRKYFPLRQFKLSGPRKVVHAAEDTSLALYPGRALALVGESGSGKTTMARMLSHLYEPTSGTILFRGEPVKGNGRNSLKTYHHPIPLAFPAPFSFPHPFHAVRYHS